jgi:hypothetical protein
MKNIKSLAKDLASRKHSIKIGAEGWDQERDISCSTILYCLKILDYAFVLPILKDVLN